MKKKGFTLIELLAVIVILAVIALIATPTILGVIEKTRKEAAEQSAYGYIDALEKQILLNEVNKNKEPIKDGKYNVKELEISYKGEKIKSGQVVIEKGQVISTKLCINKYSVEYKDKKAEISPNNYCSNDYKVELIVGETKENKKIGEENSTTFELIDISNMTNVSCNNGAKPKIENNKLIIENIYGNTTCKINDNLEETIKQLDNAETNIMMLNDEEISNTLTIKENQNVILELNDRKILFERDGFYNYGHFIINNQDSKNGTIQSKIRTIKTYGDSYTKINGGNIISIDSKTSSAVCNNGTLVIGHDAYIEGPYGIGCHDNDNAKTIIQNATIKGTIHSGLQLNSKYSGQAVIENAYIFGNLYSISNFGLGIITIKGGTFISQTDSSIYNFNTGYINIEQTNIPIYISSLNKAWSPAVWNRYGTVNIIGNKANECTADYTKTTSGLCIYSEGDGSTDINAGNGAVQNIYGTININGGTFFGMSQGINNSQNGTININNTEIKSGYTAILNHGDGIINICNSKINSEHYDVSISSASTGLVNYSDTVIFTDNTNIPIIKGSSDKVIGSYMRNCYHN